MLEGSIIYFNKEKGLERAIIKARNDQAKETRCIAYNHAISNQGLLYIRFAHSELAGSLNPDVIACTGPRMRQWLMEWGHVRPDRIDLLGSSRYCEPLSLANDTQERNKRLRVLFISGTGHEPDGLVDFVEEDPSLLSGCQLMVRLYPYFWIHEQTLALERIRAVGQSAIVNQQSLKEQIEACHVVIMASSSAGVEAMLYGRPVIYADLHDLVDLDPFAYKGDLSAMDRCFSSQDLKKALQKVRGMNEDEYATFVRKQIQMAQEIFSEPQPEQVVRILTSQKRLKELQNG